jgi:hypothetical protein
VSAAWRGWLAWLADPWVGSTRALALVRIGLPPLVWTKFGGDWLLFKHADGLGVATSVLLFAGTVALFFGAFSRAAAAVAATGLGIVYFHYGIAAGNGAVAHHHVYLLWVTLAVMALTPCGGSYSVDRWLAVRRAERAGAAPPPEAGPLWAVRLILFQVSMVYLWGAYDKTSLMFLSGMRLEQIAMNFYFGSDAPLGRSFQVAMQAGAVATVLLEYALAVGLWSRRWRRWLVPVGLAFHAVIYWTVPVATFSATMAVLYLLFLDPDAVHRTIAELQRT